MAADTPGLTPDEFRRWGREIVDWVADYWTEVEELPVVPAGPPGAIRSMLPDQAPEAPDSFASLMADLDSIVKPGLTHWQSPNWFAYFPGNASFPSILAELVSAGVGQQGMMWSTSPASTEIEAHMMDWLVDLLDLPQGWKTTGKGGGVIQGSASDASHTALVVARHLAAEDHSLDDLVAYASEEAHSSIEKGARVAGFRHFRTVPTDDAMAMRVDALADAIVQDRDAGRVPAFVCSTVGTTGTTGVDPLRQVGEIALEHDMWHHVDAAFAGSAMICPEFRHHQEGLELADSYVFNPHKWLMVNFDCSVFYVADRHPLIETLTVLPPYLRAQASESRDAIDYRDWHVPLGRRFRALKLWWVLRSFGAENLRALVRDHVRLAHDLTGLVESDARLEMVAPTVFSLVSFRHVAGPDETRRLAKDINSDGRVLITASELRGDPFIRVSIGQTNTRQEHVERLWEIIDRHASRVP